MVVAAADVFPVTELQTRASQSIRAECRPLGHRLITESLNTDTMCCTPYLCIIRSPVNSSGITP